MNDNFSILISWLVVIQFGCQIGVSGQSTEIRPVNTLTQSGAEIILTCRVPQATGAVQWYRDGVRVTNDGMILSPLNPNTHIVVGDSSAKEFNLKIMSVDASRDGAMYGCKFPVSTGNHSVYQYNARLIVIDGDMTCSGTTTASDDGTVYTLGSVVVENDDVEMTCTLGYTGGWAPDITCDNTALGTPTTNTNSTSTTQAGRTIAFNVPSKITVGRINCRAVLQNVNDHFPTDVTFDPGVEHYFDRNLPRYMSDWSTDLSIEHGPVDLAIQPTKVEHGEYSPGEVLTCSADANPSPTFEWKNAHTNDVITTGAQLTITSSMGRTIRATCIAENTATRGTVWTRTKTSTLNIRIPETTTRKSGASGLGLGFGYLNLMALVVLISGIHFW